MGVTFDPVVKVKYFDKNEIIQENPKPKKNTWSFQNLFICLVFLVIVLVSFLDFPNKEKCVAKLERG